MDVFCTVWAVFQLISSAFARQHCEHFQLEQLDKFNNISCTKTRSNESFPRCYQSQSEDCVAIGMSQLQGGERVFHTCILDYHDMDVADWNVDGFDDVHLLVYEFHPSGNSKISVAF